jgi:exonuclease SbcC
MFRKLNYDVTFPDGQKLSADLDFDPGFYAIVGSNESGKTMILEMLRFLLFGSAALRGLADDYKTLRVSGSFTIKGDEYCCVRTSKSAELTRNGDTIASGVTTVNEKIGQILGFGLPIFDVACSINQGEVERLGQMTSGERKKLVDGVLGIDALDVVVGWGLAEARVLDKEAETIRRSLVAPVEPEQPVDYKPSDQIDLSALRDQARELAEINGFLSHPRTEPARPSEICTQTSDELRPLAEQQKAVRERIATLEVKIGALPSEAPAVPDDIDDQWVAFDAYQSAQRYLTQNPKPQHFEMQARIFIDDWSALGNINERRLLQVQIDALMAKGTKPCPHCHEEIPLEEETIKLLEQKRDVLEVPEYGFVPSTPPISKDQCLATIEAWHRFDQQAHDHASGVKEVQHPTVPRELISTYRAKVGQVAEREQLVVELATLDPGEVNYESLLIRREAYEEDLIRFETQHAEWISWSAERDRKVARAQELQGADDRLQIAQERHQTAVRYEEALERFACSVTLYDDGVARADELEAEANKHRKVKQLMTVLRSLIKQHLMPSLNKVASHLIQGMTGGQRQQVYVDENFNVVVDTKRLETLSGSAKACTNLAIRIALGQVLTNKTFSVLLADEIDASFDDARAQNTSNVLDTLANSISQILLVSHKPIEATNVIELGASVDFGRTSSEGTV